MVKIRNVRIKVAYMMGRRGLDDEAQITGNARPHRGFLHGKFTTVAQNFLVGDTVHLLLGLGDDPTGSEGVSAELLKEGGLDRGRLKLQRLEESQRSRKDAYRRLLRIGEGQRR